jgi:hypothetical protein
MVYDPANNEQIASTYSQVFKEIYDFLTTLTAESILEGKEYDGSLENWLHFKQSNVKKLTEEATKIADNAFGAIRPSIQGAVEVAYSVGETTAAAELLSAGISTDVSGGFQNLAEYSLDGLIDAAVNRFGNRVNKLDIVRSTQDVYSEVTESAAALVASGAATLEEAVETAVDKFLDEGIKSINVGNRKMRIDAYAETSIRTIAGNAQVQGSLDRYEDADQYLSWVSDSPMECEKCRKYEGKILRTTNDLEKIPEQYHSLDSLEMAKQGGLFHPNCTHSLQVYIEGYSTPPTDTNDEANVKRRNNIRRLQRLERTNKLKEKIYRADGQTNRAKGAKARAAKYKAQRRQFEAGIERKSLGWFTGEDRLRRLAEANGIKPEVLEAAKGNLPALNKLAKNTGFDPRLVSTDVRAGVAKVIEPPDISEIFEATGVSDYRQLPQVIKEDLRLKYKQFFESEFGSMAFLQNEGAFHNPPPLPDKTKKMNKVQFDEFIKSNRKKYTNEYGTWEWNNKKGKPDIIWEDGLVTNKWKPEIDNLLAEAEAAGALAEKRQVVAGGLPSSGKTFLIANKAGNPSLKTYKLDEYVVLNSDDFKTKLIFQRYASATDRRLNDLLSDTFVNSKDFGVGTKLTADNPFMKQLKLSHPEIYDIALGKDFEKSVLTDIREEIASKVPIGDTGLFGYEAANILHEESSAMLKAAQDAASDKGLNIVHDVTMGSNKPVKLVEDLVDAKGYEPAEVMFIMYSQEQAADSVIDRYIRKNFDMGNNRGGRYVMSVVLDDATKKIKDKDFANKTIDLLGRPALTDNEVFLAELLESNAVTQNADDIQIVNRYSDIDYDTGQANPYPVEIIRDSNGKYTVAKSSSKSKKIAIDGMKVKNKTQIAIPTNKAGINELDKIIDEQVIQTDDRYKQLAGRNIGIKSAFYDKIAKRKRYFEQISLKSDDPALYIIAKEKGFTGKPAKVKNGRELAGDDKLFDFNRNRDVVKKIGSGINIVDETIQDDVIVFRGLSDATDIDQDTWILTDDKIPVSERAASIAAKSGVYDDDRIPKKYVRQVKVAATEYLKAEEAVNGMKRYINNMNLQGFDSEYIDADIFKEAQDEWRALKIKEIEAGIGDGRFRMYDFNVSQEFVDEGYIMLGLFAEEEFQIIYDEKLYASGINVKQVKKPPIVKTGMSIHEEFVDGDYYSGNSAIYGYGTYTDTDFTVAEGYSSFAIDTRGRGTGGVVQAIKIKKGTRMPSQEVIDKVTQQVSEKNSELYDLTKHYNEDNIRLSRELRLTVEYDIGRTLAAMGYQAYDVSMIDSIKSHVVILDRTAVVVAEQPIMINGELKG